MKYASRYFPIVVLGATFAALGTAYSRLKETLVIERTALAGSEFINSFHLGLDWLLCRG